MFRRRQHFWRETRKRFLLQVFRRKHKATHCLLREAGPATAPSEPPAHHLQNTGVRATPQGPKQVQIKQQTQLLSLTQECAQEGWATQTSNNLLQIFLIQDYFLTNMGAKSLRFYYLLYFNNSFMLPNTCRITTVLSYLFPLTPASSMGVSQPSQTTVPLQIVRDVPPLSWNWIM